MLAGNTEAAVSWFYLNQQSNYIFKNKCAFSKDVLFMYVQARPTRKTTTKIPKTTRARGTRSTGSTSTEKTILSTTTDTHTSSELVTEVSKDASTIVELITNEATTEEAVTKNASTSTIVGHSNATEEGPLSTPTELVTSKSTTEPSSPSTTTETTQLPSTATVTKFVCPSSGNFPNPSPCSGTFYMCSNGTPYLFVSCLSYYP